MIDVGETCVKNDAKFVFFKIRFHHEKQHMLTISKKIKIMSLKQSEMSTFRDAVCFFNFRNSYTH